MLIEWWRDQPVRLLLTWARWLTLRHPTIRLTNIYVSLAGGLLTLALFRIAPSFNVTREMGLIQQVNGLLQALGPFFVAALALVSGFPGEALDKPMGGQQPFLYVNGHEYCPTRRELLGYLFAYLAGLSVILYAVGAIVSAAANPHPAHALVWLATSFDGWPASMLKALYCASLLHLMAVTLLGLHFLGNFLSGSTLARSGPSPNGTGTSPVTPISATHASRRAQGAGNKDTTQAGQRKWASH